MRSGKCRSMCAMMVEGWRGGAANFSFKANTKTKTKTVEFYIYIFKASVRSMHVMMVDGLERIAFDASLKYENS